MCPSPGRGLKAPVHLALAQTNKHFIGFYELNYLSLEKLIVIETTLSCITASTDLLKVYSFAQPVLRSKVHILRRFSEKVRRRASSRSQLLEAL